jgi:hypothetical protein
MQPRLRVSTECIDDRPNHAGYRLHEIEQTCETVEVPGLGLRDWFRLTPQARNDLLRYLVPSPSFVTLLAELSAFFPLPRFHLPFKSSPPQTHPST